MQSYLQWQESRRYIRDQSTTSVSIKDFAAPSDRQSNAVEKQGTDSDALIMVEFEENDGQQPRNWSFTRKVCTTLIVLSTGVVGGWASSNDS